MASSALAQLVLQPGVFRQAIERIGIQYQPGAVLQQSAQHLRDALTASAASHHGQMLQVEIA